jgi:radical SAM superfamily enzyme YgiQ (UPF0313 family)
MRVLLIDPAKVLTDRRLGNFTMSSSSGPNIGLLSIAAALMEDGHETAYFWVNDWNCRLEDLPARLSNRIQGFRPDIVGISTTAYTISEDANIAFMVRTMLPEALIIMGGYFAWSNPEDVLRFTEADMVIRGHGEIPMKALLRLDPKRSKTPSLKEDFAKIPGVCFRYEEENAERYHLSPPFLLDATSVKSLPVPAYDMFPFDRYDLDNNYVPIYTSKGCTYACRFCSIPKFEGNFLLLPHEKVESAIIKVSSLGAKHIFISDPDFNLDRNHAIDVCDTIICLKGSGKIPEQTDFQCQARIDLLDDGLLMKMKEAGFARVSLGIESISEDIVQKDIRKGLKMKKEQVVSMLDKIRSTGIIPMCYFILGTPGTRMCHLEENLAFIRQKVEEGYEIEVNSLVNAFPETQYFNDCKRLAKFIQITFLRFKEGIIQQSKYRKPYVLMTRDRKVYKRILYLRNRANQLCRKDSDLTFEQALLRVATS